jgi:hypothetical protein
VSCRFEQRKRGSGELHEPFATDRLYEFIRVGGLGLTEGRMK